MNDNLKNVTSDERILTERRKIQSRGYAYIVYILLISIFVQKLFMNAPFSQYAVELFLLIGCGLYNAAANLKKGINIIDHRGTSKKELLLSTVISGIVSVIAYAFFTGQYEIDGLAVYFVFFVIAFFGIQLITTSLSRKRQEKIDRMFDDDEDI